MGAKADFWKGHRADWRSRGLTQAVYCRQYGLSLSGFGYWHRRLGKAEAASFAALVLIVIDEASAPEEAIEVPLPNSLRAPPWGAPTLGLLRQWL